MNQVGDQVGLMTAPVPSGSAIYSYAWDFWDGTSTATAAPFVAKVINIGGQPGTDELHYQCTPVAIDGQHVTLNGTIWANGEPTILPGVSISNNDDYFAYSTQLSLRAINQDGDLFSFAWYTGTTFLGLGTTAAIGSASGTWTGNGTTVIANYPARENHIGLVVASSRIVTCYVTDTRGGTTSVDFALRGEANPPPDATVAAGVGGASFDASTPPTARIGTGQTVDFTVYVAPMPSHSMGFQWDFSGSNNWTMPPATESGTTAVLANGGFQNTVHRDISTEVVSTGTSKAATAGVRIVATNAFSGQLTHTDAQFEITLIANSIPSSVTVTRKVNNVDITGFGPVVAGSAIQFSAVGTDADLDVLFYKWQIAQPFTPNPVYFWGPKFVYDTTGYAGGQSVQGQLAVIDRLGGQLNVVIPVTNIT